MKGTLALISSVFLLIEVVSGCPLRCLCHHYSKTVDCRNQGLVEVPSQLSVQTQILLLSNNRIQKIGQRAFADALALKILDLSNNSISSLSPSPFQGLRHLQILNLTKNFIEYIDNKTFSSLPHLKELDLSSNSIVNLPGTLGNNTGNITLLSLKHNKLQKVDRLLLELLPNLKVVLFKGNSWQCTCQVFGLKLWLESFLYRGGISDAVICSTPENRKGKDLLKIPYEMYGICPPTASEVHRASALHHNSESTGSQKHAHHNGDSSHSHCEPKPKPRPVNLRHAIATVVITGVVCGIVCLMMLAAAVYGCAYAAITAKYHREHLAPGKEKGNLEGKEPFESLLA
ncbi:leucine-rich repeat and transmembrane domain-containing protein 1 [Hemicordylus capensis]|uniref:leucine-rich repeat and transmembrane domain-containing protein 1 n=1 Tax=Hemicordylus capensis TaxID=884348 RepID=UPI0023046C1C|nr:leucine-rich repeat and transmembrane domain-containing protein 1 [Hemicordylus capensis]